MRMGLLHQPKLPFGYLAAFLTIGVILGFYALNLHGKTKRLVRVQNIASKEEFVLTRPKIPSWNLAASEKTENPKASSLKNPPTEKAQSPEVLSPKNLPPPKPQNVELMTSNSGTLTENNGKTPTKIENAALRLEKEKPTKPRTNSVEHLTESARNFQPFLSYSKIYKVPQVVCSDVINGKNLDEAINISKALQSYTLPDDYYYREPQNCENFIQTRGYITDSITEEEKNFPLAFSILVFTDLEMFERLLRAIYRPQNHYCVHVDYKASAHVFWAIHGIIHCLPNVFFTSRRVNVKWGRFSVLEPELICMEALYRLNFKYFINLTGQEFPLKTNLELVRILKAFNWANDVEGTIIRSDTTRWKTPPPLGIRPVKGSVHITVNRDFVEYILKNDTAQEFLNWVKNTWIPDETFFASLQHNPQLGIPGTYKGTPEIDINNPYLSRFKNWKKVGLFKWPCAGNVTRGICILSTGDLPMLSKRPELFANKFHLSEDRIVIGCLEEKHFNDTRDEYLGKLEIDTTFYSSLDFVKNQVTRRPNS